MEFEIIDHFGQTWELYFADSDTSEGTLFFQGHQIGRFTESAAIAYIERETAGKVDSVSFGSLGGDALR